MQLAFFKHTTLRQCVNQEPEDKDPVLLHKHTDELKKTKANNEFLDSDVSDVAKQA